MSQAGEHLMLYYTQKQIRGPVFMLPLCGEIVTNSSEISLQHIAVTA
jgi:hypothetical protein